MAERLINVIGKSTSRYLDIRVVSINL